MWKPALFLGDSSEYRLMPFQLAAENERHAARAAPSLVKPQALISSSMISRVASRHRADAGRCVTSIGGAAYCRARDGRRIAEARPRQRKWLSA